MDDTKSVESTIDEDDFFDRIVGGLQKIDMSDSDTDTSSDSEYSIVKEGEESETYEGGESSPFIEYEENETYTIGLSPFIEYDGGQPPLEFDDHPYYNPEDISPFIEQGNTSTLELPDYIGGGINLDDLFTPEPPIVLRTKSPSYSSDKYEDIEITDDSVKFLITDMVERL